MRINRYIGILSILALSISCSEIIPEDSTPIFARRVVGDMYSESIILPMVDVSTIHKLSVWRDSIESTTARYEIEDMYFSKIAPRSYESKIILMTLEGTEIEVEHNAIPVTSIGAEWSILAAGSASSKRITIKNEDGEQWVCTQEEQNGEKTCSFTVEWSNIDSYLVTVDGVSNNVYKNTPVVGQRFFSETKLALLSRYDPPYGIFEHLYIDYGTFTIELLSDSGAAIAGDDILVSFEGNKSYYDYNGLEVANPRIQFRNNIFYCSEF